MIISRNPASGEILAELPSTDPETLPEFFARARQAQAHWANLPVQRRAEVLLRIKEVLINRTEEIVTLIVKENGKPRNEALWLEITPIVTMLDYFAKKGPAQIKDQPLSLSLMKHRKSYLSHWPMGIIAIISPWNMPFILPFADILMGLLAGNAIIFKPSEVTPLIGLKIQELCSEAGLPPYLLQTIIGDGKLGAALIEQQPNKIFFTGSVQTGKKIMASAAQSLTPVNLELGGKDAMIVLADADLDFATSVALWGAYSNSGQLCASTERLLIHERISAPFLELFKAKIQKLRVGPSDETSSNDIGPITFEAQKKVYLAHLQQAQEKQATFLIGGQFSTDQRYLPPTALTSSKPSELDVYHQETFGPIVAIDTFKTMHEAIQKTNSSPYGLLASIITKDISMGESIARQLEVGTVTINEVLYTAGLGETPWGGIKASGIGTTHSLVGLNEFMHTRHVHKPRTGFKFFKAPWWYPYTNLQYEAGLRFLDLFRNSRFDRIKAIPVVLKTFLDLFKNEPRL